MFTAEQLLVLLRTRPFVPFRLHLSGGETVDIISPEMALPGRRFVVVGILDPKRNDSLSDRWKIVYYMHVTQTELLGPGPPPFAAPPETSGTPTPMTP